MKKTILICLMMVLFLVIGSSVMAGAKSKNACLADPPANFICSTDVSAETVSCFWDALFGANKYDFEIVFEVPVINMKESQKVNFEVVTRDTNITVTFAELQALLDPFQAALIGQSATAKVRGFNHSQRGTCSLINVYAETTLDLTPPPTPTRYVIDDFNKYPTTAITRPAKGESVIDPIYNMKITRITDNTEWSAWNPYGLNMVPYYGTADPENADGTYLLLTISEWLWFLYEAKPPFKLIKQIDPKKLGYVNGWDGGPIEAHWDVTDPNIFYYILHKGETAQADRATFNMYNVTSDTRTILYDFKTDYPTASIVATMTEGSPSKDTRYWAWFVLDNNKQPLSIVVYDKDFYGINQGKITASYDYPPCSGDHLTISPDGDYIFIPHGMCGGLNLYNQTYPVSNFPEVRYSMCCGGHADTAVAVTNGVAEEVYWRQDQSWDVVGFSEFTPDGGTWHLFSPCGTGQSPYCAGMEYSGHNYNKPGWGVIRFYDNNGGWWDDEIIMVELNKNKCDKYKKPASAAEFSICPEKARVWRIAKGRHGVSGSRYWDAWATINRKGTRIYFGSDWGDPNAPIDTYMIELPDTWYHDLMK